MILSTRPYRVTVRTKPAKYMRSEQNKGTIEMFAACEEGIVSMKDDTPHVNFNVAFFSLNDLKSFLVTPYDRIRDIFPTMNRNPSHFQLKLVFRAPIWLPRKITCRHLYVNNPPDATVSGLARAMDFNDIEKCHFNIVYNNNYVTRKLVVKLFKYCGSSLEDISLILGTHELPLWLDNAIAFSRSNANEISISLLGERRRNLRPAAL